MKTLNEGISFRRMIFHHPSRVRERISSSMWLTNTLLRHFFLLCLSVELNLKVYNKETAATEMLWLRFEFNLEDCFSHAITSRGGWGGEGFISGFIFQAPAICYNNIVPTRIMMITQSDTPFLTKTRFCLESLALPKTHVIVLANLRWEGYYATASRWGLQNKGLFCFKQPDWLIQLHSWNRFPLNCPGIKLGGSVF